VCMGGRQSCAMDGGRIGRVRNGLSTVPQSEVPPSGEGSQETSLIKQGCTFKKNNNTVMALCGLSPGNISTRLLWSNIEFGVIWGQ
jgi:hypothetical protein